MRDKAGQANLPERVEGRLAGPEKNGISDGLIDRRSLEAGLPRS